MSKPRRTPADPRHPRRRAVARRPRRGAPDAAHTRPRGPRLVLWLVWSTTPVPRHWSGSVQGLRVRPCSAAAAISVAAAVSSHRERVGLRRSAGARGVRARRGRGPGAAARPGRRLRALVLAAVRPRRPPARQRAGAHVDALTLCPSCSSTCPGRAGDRPGRRAGRRVAHPSPPIPCSSRVVPRRSPSTGSTATW